MISHLEIPDRIINLRKKAHAFLEKSSVCTKVTDVAAFVDLAARLSAEADALEDSTKIESCWIYLHFIRSFDYANTYASYCEFCVRNSMTIVSEDDFLLALSFPTSTTVEPERQPK